jgi:cardiolipin synthase
MDTPAALFDHLRQGGVNVVEYNPLTPDAIFDINRRDHQKLLVVDNRVAILGGVNVSQVYENRHHHGLHISDPDQMAWRDTDVRLTGPAVGEFERLFLKTWYDQKGTLLPAPPPPTATPQGSALVQGIDGEPGTGRPLIYRTLMVAIALARSSVHLTTGYFVPTPDLDKALKEAARRGIDVEIVCPAHSDSSASLAAGRSYYEDLLEAGARIFERKGAVLHAKTAVIDGAWSTVGSSNLDWRSVIFNSEIDAVILDAGFGQQMETLFQEDIAHSHEIIRAEWSKRPFGEKLDEWRSRLFEFML